MKNNPPYKSIKLNEYTINIYREFIPKFKQYAYNHEVISPYNIMGSGSFQINGDISYNTLDKVLNAAIKMASIPKDIIREYKLKQILENDNTR